MLLIEHSRDRSDEFPGAGSWMQNEMLQRMLNTKMASTSRITLENPSLFFSTATQPRGFVGFTTKKTTMQISCSMWNSTQATLEGKIRLYTCWVKCVSSQTEYSEVGETTLWLKSTADLCLFYSLVGQCFKLIHTSSNKNRPKCWVIQHVKRSCILNRLKTTKLLQLIQKLDYSKDALLWGKNILRHG